MAWHKVRVLHSFDPKVLAITFPAVLVGGLNLRVDTKVYYRRTSDSLLQLVAHSEQADLLVDLEYNDWPVARAKLHRDGSITYYVEAVKNTHEAIEASMQVNRASQTFLIHLK